MNQSQAESKRSKLAWVLVSVLISAVIGTIVSIYVKRLFEEDKTIPFHASVLYGIGSFVLPERTYDRLEIRLFNDGKRPIEELHVKVRADYLQHVEPQRSRECVYQELRVIANEGEHAWTCRVINPEECILLTLRYPLDKRRVGWIDLWAKASGVLYSKRIDLEERGAAWIGRRCHE